MTPTLTVTRSRTASFARLLGHLLTALGLLLTLTSGTLAQQQQQQQTFQTPEAAAEALVAAAKAADARALLRVLVLMARTSSRPATRSPTPTIAS